MNKGRFLYKTRMVSVSVLASSLFVLPILAHSAETQEMPPANQSPASPQVQKVSPYHANRVSKHAKEYYQSIWGVDNMLVHMTASGNLIRFSYHVNDPVRAKSLGDEHATPYLLGLRSRAMLHVPVMENIGQLRQAVKPEAGKDYWMVFSNKGNLVKVGDRVNVIIGSFHAEGLMVE
jgi:hypothetical protein